METGKQASKARDVSVLPASGWATSPAALSLPRPPFYSGHPSFGPHPVVFLVLFLPWLVCWVTTAQAHPFSWPQFTHL